MFVRNFLKILSQRILVGMILVGRLGVTRHEGATRRRLRVDWGALRVSGRMWMCGRDAVRAGICGPRLCTGSLGLWCCWMPGRREATLGQRDDRVSRTGCRVNLASAAYCQTKKDCQAGSEGRARAIGRSRRRERRRLRVSYQHAVLGRGPSMSCR